MWRLCLKQGEPLTHGARHQATKNAYDVHLDVDAFEKLPTTSKDIKASPHKYKPATIDYEALVPRFGYRPIKVIKEMFKRTTQLGSNTLRYPMRLH